ncbi:MAG: FAD-dependent oxidoreductase [Acidobacteria bacterium]|nr:FAD-dependent oxidoreductase [Acidobacteriota bacterium]
MTESNSINFSISDSPNFSLHEENNFQLGIAGFKYSDLYQSTRLRELAEIFYSEVAKENPELWSIWQPYLDTAGKGHNLSPKAESDLIVKMAPYLSRFLEKLFPIKEDLGKIKAQTDREKLVMQLKRNFISRAMKKYTLAQLPEFDLTTLRTQATLLQEIAFADTLWEVDAEFGMAQMAVSLVNLEKEYDKHFTNPKNLLTQATRNSVNNLRSVLEKHSVMQSLLEESQLSEKELETFTETANSRQEHKFIKRLLTMLEAWSFARYHSKETHAEVADWLSYKHPEALEYQQLVKLNRPKQTDLPEMLYGPEDKLRRRDGFKLTDRRFNFKEVYHEIDYCLYCHERDKDSCSKGFLEKDQTFRKNPLSIPLEGCPLDEKISEAHILKREGESLAALATIIIDNPMLPGTGHRICNDCMKSCIFQKQEPVNIPQAETGILTDVLSLPYGFEIYGLLTRWNPLNVRRPFMLPYNGKNVLVVGLGPAGYTLAHYLLNEGFGVVGIDGLKIEPLPKELTGTYTIPPQPIRNINEFCQELDERILLGFGGVSEYGITVRWDKNFLMMIYLTLMRRKNLRVYGGVRFGGTVTIDDAWDMGFDHIAIATGAGKPTIVEMKNNLIRGIRKASDFLMALQLTGAFKKNNMANLQVQLPAIVIGGGLTGIDTATELFAYYPIQVEKTLDRFEKMAQDIGEEKIWSTLSQDEKEILRTFLDHGRLVRAERLRARHSGEEPNFVPLVRSWGGVSLVYRKSLADSPAYRLNHEEVIKALEEGIAIMENLTPAEVIPDEYGAVSAIKFERSKLDENGKWKPSGEFITLPAKSVCVAAGTSPNIIYEKEQPGTFKLDKWNQFFAGFKADVDDSGKVSLTPATGKDRDAFFTSYEKDGRYITYYGDNHPAYAGNVVKAMASAKQGYQHITKLFVQELANLDPSEQFIRDKKFRALTEKLDNDLRAEIVRVDRLTPTIVEVIVYAPLAARKFKPGQFYRLQNFEVDSHNIDGTTLALEGIALTGAWMDEEKGLLSTIVLEMGVSSRLCASLRPGQRVILMGPTGTPTEIPQDKKVLLAGGGLGNAVLFSIAKAMREAGNWVVYFAAYRKAEDMYKRDEVESSADMVVWSVDGGDLIPVNPNRPQDRSFRGNVVQAMQAYSKGELGEVPVALCDIDHMVVIGSDRMMAAVKNARKSSLVDQFRPNHIAIGSINSPMQCMMKEVCAQCLQKHIDPVTGKESFVFSCFNQDQELDLVDFTNLNDRLRANSLQEKLSNMWLDYLLNKKQVMLI